jgi:hypothetical protein
MNFLKATKKAVKGAGALSGLSKTKPDGRLVESRQIRLITSVAVLVGALLAWAGIPEDVATALTDVAVELSTEAVAE